MVDGLVGEHGPERPAAGSAGGSPRSGLKKHRRSLRIHPILER